MTSETKLILEELKDIREDVDCIKKHIINVDMIVTDDDVESIKEAERDLKEGRTKRLV
ncbi:hypothetical protein J4404_00345 [Candidatus Woesearchaeota archaeon]|nr:hypothetical protein [Candidatus Woesearchaeota archaeon]